jgi:copper homeostasis protein
MSQENKKILEICADSCEGAQIAQSAGAYRIELCTGLREGGMTPSPALISEVCASVTLKVYVLIRPRSGDFLYTGADFEIMKSNIRYCGEAGCDGVVIGMLRPDGTIDKERCRELVEIAKEYPMGVTFHRAFDRSNDLFQAMEDCIEIGCERILTSGGYNTAPEGAEVLRRLIEKANGRIVIMPGAGISPGNAGDLIRTTGLQEIHGTFRSFYPGKMQYKNTKLSHPEDEYNLGLPDAEKIKVGFSLLNS